MSKRGWMVVLVVCFFGISGVCEASQLSAGIAKTWSFLFAPINCAGNLISDLVATSVHFVQCVIANANPGNLIP